MGEECCVSAWANGYRVRVESEAEAKSGQAIKQFQVKYIAFYYYSNEIAHWRIFGGGV